MIDNGLILLPTIVAFILGRKSILIGLLTGVISSIILYLIINGFSFESFINEMLWAIVLCISASVLGRIILPGLNGGGHNSGPTYIGGFDEGFGTEGGIMLTDEERKNKRDNERKIP